MTRFEQKKRSTHDLILRAAERVIDDDGLGSLSLDRIAEAANVSRATLFNHIHSRDGLLAEVLLPVFDDCISMLESIVKSKKKIGAEDIGAACIYIWNRHKGIAFRPDTARSISVIPTLRDKHEKIIALFSGLFRSLPKSRKLRLSDPVRSARLVFRTFVPILDTLADDGDDKDLFLKCLSALIFS